MILASTLTTNLAILVLAGFIGFVVISKVPEHAAHAADVGHQRDPRDRAARRAAGARPRRQRHVQQGHPRDRDRVRHDQHRRRLPRHRPHARDVQVQAQAAPAGDDGESREGEGRRERSLPLATAFLQNESFLDVLYIIAFALFIQGLRGLAGPTTAVRGNRIAAVGMAIAVIATLLNPSEGNWGLIALGVALGAAVGVPAARQVKMTAMPQMVALFNGVGGGAVFLIAWAEFRRHGSTYGGHTLHVGRAPRRHAARPPDARASPTYIAIFSVFAAIVGSVSFWGSNIAFGKLQEIIPGRPITLGAGPADRQPRAARARARRRHRPGRRRALRTAVHRHARLRGAARQRRRAADRRRRHAGRDLAAERLHRPVRGGHGDRAEQPRADRRRHDRRRLRLDPDEPDGGRDEPLDPLDHRRRLRRRRRGRGRRAAPASTPAPCARRAPPTRRSSSPTPTAS